EGGGHVVAGDAVGPLPLPLAVGGADRVGHADLVVAALLGGPLEPAPDGRAHRLRQLPCHLLHARAVRGPGLPRMVARPDAAPGRPSSVAGPAPPAALQAPAPSFAAASVTAAPLGVWPSPASPTPSASPAPAS